MQKKMRQWPIPLLSAEAEMKLTVDNFGPRANITVEFSNPILSGNVSGLTTRFLVPWKRLAEFGTALVMEGGIAQQIREGNHVLGKDYTPVKMDLNPMCHVVVYLTPTDCETIAHCCGEAAKYATDKDYDRK